MHNLLLHCLVITARVQLGTGHEADVSCPSVAKADLEFLSVSGWSNTARTYSHLDAEQLEQTSLLSRQLFTIPANDVRVVETRYTLDEDGGEAEGAELRVHAVGEGVGLV